MIPRRLRIVKSDLRRALYHLALYGPTCLPAASEMLTLLMVRGKLNRICESDCKRCEPGRAGVASAPSAAASRGKTPR